MGIVLFLLVLSEITYGEIASFSNLKSMSVFGDAGYNFTQHNSEVWILRSNCRLNQNGSQSAEAAAMVLWIEHDTQQIRGSINGSYRVTVYMNGQITTDPALKIGFVSENIPASGGTNSWIGDFLLLSKPQISVKLKQTYPGKTPELYWQAQRCREVQSDQKSAAITKINSTISEQKWQSAPISGAIGQSANSQSVNSIVENNNSNSNAQSGSSFSLNSDLGNILPVDLGTALESGQRLITVTARNDIPLNFNWKTQPDTDVSVVYLSGGINMTVAGTGPEGTIDITADKLVIWSDGKNVPDLNGNKSQSNTLPLQVYLEGNVVFRQGDRKLIADKMFYDVTLKRGTILNSQIWTPADGYEGLLRINAEKLQQLNANEFYAENAFVTSSMMGKPSYRIQMDSVMIRDQVSPIIDPVTGLQKEDPLQKTPLYSHQQYIDGKNGTVYAGDVPIFYWPSATTKLEQPTMYIRSLRVGSDSTYGFQLFTGWNAYELFGCTNPPEGTDLTLNIDPLTNRGIGHGAVFDFDRYMESGLFSGPINGQIDFWGIYDWGKDNLGEGRRSVVPEQKYRYKLNTQARHVFSNGLELTAETGILSDRDFMQEYFKDDWFLKKSPATGLQLRQEIGNLSWDIALDAKVNNFYTETQQLPRADLYWLGESLLSDSLTWYSASSAGYYKLSPGSYPTAKENQQFFDYLNWEQANAGGRFVTRNELDYPFQAGPVKVVPYVLGEAGWWGANETGNVDRLYGQVGIRAAMPFWKAFPGVRNQLLDLHGIVHKASLELEWYWGDSSRSMYDMPLYDMLDDQSIIQYRHMFGATVFGGPTPYRFDERSYALRSGLGNHVTSPGIEILDDINVIRLGLNQRWQTKRGPEGRQRIIDWITLDAGISLYPDRNRDNYGSFAGLANYDFGWRLGDRFSVVSSGLWDFFDDGIHAWSIGGKLEKPGQGELYAGIHFLSGPVKNTVLSLSAKYWMSPKWHITFGSDFDIEGQGNIGQSFAITRVGESLLVRAGFYVDATRDDYGFSLTLEPRFLSKGSIGNSIGGIHPTGAYGLE